MTRRLCANPVCKEGGYFTPSTPEAVLCDVCARKFHDLELAEIKQDNGPDAPFHAPDDAMTRIQLKIANARLLRELNEWKRFGRASYSALCALATPRMFPKDRETLAKRHLEIFEKDFPEVVEDINGPVYGQRQG